MQADARKIAELIRRLSWNPILDNIFINHTAPLPVLSGVSMKNSHPRISAA